MIQYGVISADVSSVYGEGSIHTDNVGVGATLTWYGDNGVYVDGQAQVTVYFGDLSSDTAGTSLVEDDGAVGYGLSLEAGRKIPVGEAWSLTPQAQLAYSAVDFDFVDAFGAAVSSEDGDSLRGRLGLSADYDRRWTDAAGETRRSHLYGLANLYYEFLDGTETDVDGTAFTSENDPLWGGLGLGGTYGWADGKYAVYGEALVNTSLESFGDSYALGATGGLRVQW